VEGSVSPAPGFVSVINGFPSVDAIAIPP